MADVDVARAARDGGPDGCGLAPRPTADQQLTAGAAVRAGGGGGPVAVRST